MIWCINHSKPAGTCTQGDREKVRCHFMPTEPAKATTTTAALLAEKPKAKPRKKKRAA